MNEFIAVNVYINVNIAIKNIMMLAIIKSIRGYIRVSIVSSLIISLVNLFLFLKGEKPYMCTVCGKQFHRSDYLKLHSFQHTDERPFYCPICNKGFKMNYNLKIHLKNHESEPMASLHHYEEKDCLKDEFTNLDDEHEVIDENQDDQQQQEYISLLAQVEEDEIDEFDVEIQHHSNTNSNTNKYNKIGSYIINSNDEFNFTSYNNNNNNNSNNIRITNSKDQINNLINISAISNNNNQNSLNLDTLNF